MDDAPVLPLMLDVMAAAGRHDEAECLRLLAGAEALLGNRFHQARQPILAACDRAREHDWAGVWRLAHSATCGLTGPFPPDPAVCPPMPGALPFTDATICACGHDLPRGARFCPMCGIARPSVEK
jgi:hypothetical protein